jgi:hypothetical protein
LAISWNIKGLDPKKVWKKSRRGLFDPLSRTLGPAASAHVFLLFQKDMSKGCVATAAAPSPFVHVAGLRRDARRVAMDDHAVDTSELDQLQGAYKKAVEAWIAAIKEEEALASVNHSVAELDQWEAAHFKEDELRNSVKAAKKQYEDALRVKFFDF